MPTRTITIRGVPDPVLRRLRAAGEASRRSLNAELLLILEHAAAEPGRGTPPVLRAVREPTAPLYAPSPPSPAGPGVVDARALAAVCRRYHITRVSLFGSRARGVAPTDSDVDVVVDFEPGMTPGLGLEMVAQALRPVFGGRSVDLVTGRGLSPRLREQIAASAVPLYGA